MYISSIWKHTETPGFLTPLYIYEKTTTWNYIVFHFTTIYFEEITYMSSLESPQYIQQDDHHVPSHVLRNNRSRIFKPFPMLIAVKQYSRSTKYYIVNVFAFLCYVYEIYSWMDEQSFLPKTTCCVNRLPMRRLPKWTGIVIYIEKEYSRWVTTQRQCVVSADSKVHRWNLFGLSWPERCNARTPRVIIARNASVMANWTLISTLRGMYISSICMQDCAYTSYHASHQQTVVVTHDVPLSCATHKKQKRHHHMSERAPFSFVYHDIMSTHRYINIYIYAKRIRTAIPFLLFDTFHFGALFGVAKYIHE